MRALRILALTVLALAMSLGHLAPATAAPWKSNHRGVSVSGEVRAPATYSVQDLAKQFPTVRHGRASGVSLYEVVSRAQPAVDPAIKNGILRGTVTVQGPGRHAVTFALGELEPTFGQHDALLVTSLNGRVLRSGPALMVPGDSGRGRAIGRVTRMTVAVHAPRIAEAKQRGGIVVLDGARRVTITRAQLQALPQVSHVGEPWTGRTFTGPTLASVLKRAGVRTHSSSVVLAVAASDAHTVAVTPGEEKWGGRHLMVVLAEDGQPLDLPRLGAIGDARGARYVTGLTTLDVRRC